jgi:Fe2+ transport system protein FeoA
MPAGWPVEPEFEQAENAELVTLADLETGRVAEIVRLAEHDGDLLHWFYEAGLAPGTRVEMRSVERAAGQLTIAVDGADRPIPEKAALGIYVRAA